MNPTPHDQNDEKWQALLALSAPTFAGEAAPPYGFVARTLARLKAEKKESELFERIGWRALLASLAVLTVTVGVTLSLPTPDRGDLEPGVRSLIQLQDIPIS